MENIHKILKQGISILIFCIAISMLFLQFRNYQNLLVKTQSIFNEDVAYKQYHEAEKLNIKKGEIILHLLNQLDYDVEIDGQLISKYDNVKETIPFYSIVDKDYTKSYAYDMNGNITRIIFKSMN